LFMTCVCVINITSSTCPTSTPSNIEISINDTNTIRFLQIGDWGGVNREPYVSKHQNECAVGMDAVASNISAQFIIGSGDNFYNVGVNDVHDSRFDLSWGNVYFNGIYIRDMPWYHIAGNHDHLGNVSAQLLYSMIDPRWTFPSLYYKKTFYSIDKSISIDIIFIDTITLTNVRSGSDYPDDIQDLVQYNWIKETLASSQANYILVNGHYPVYSPCFYGTVKTLANHLKPLLEQYSAHYVSGHEHCLAHFVDINTNYWLNGIGREGCYSNYEVGNVPDGTLMYHLAKNLPYKLLDGVGNTKTGFSSIIVTKEAMIVRFHNQLGEALYVSAVPPRL